MKSIQYIAMLACSVVLFSGCSSDKKTVVTSSYDTIFINGDIRTLDDKDTTVEAMAIQDGEIKQLGTTKELEKLAGEKTEIINLEGKTVTPSFTDSHIHMPGNGYVDLFNVNLADGKSLDDYKKAIQDYMKAHPEAKMVYGVGWTISAFEGDDKQKGPKKEYLDAISTEIPIVLESYDRHTMWMNSKAFEMYGIKADTPVPPGGIIAKNDQTGDVWGTLTDDAKFLVPDTEYTTEEHKEAVLYFQKFLNSFGITNIYALPYGTTVVNNEPIYKAIQELEKEGKLKLNISASVIIHPDKYKEEMERVKELQKTYNSKHFKIIGVKIFADGVIEAGTGYLSQPYAEALQRGKHHHGGMVWKEEQLHEAIQLAVQDDFQVHVHSIGDESTTVTLDGFEKVATKSKEKDLRHTITHLQLVKPTDVERMKKLNIIASTQPYWHLKEPGWWKEVDATFLGEERAEKEYPLGSLFDEGIIVTGSSDHNVTPIPNPFLAIEAGVTRNLNDPDYYEVPDITSMDDPTYLLNKEERASVNEMMAAFSKNGAYQIFRDKQVGTLEEGKDATFIVLSDNPFTISPLKLNEVKVENMYFEGEKIVESN